MNRFLATLALAASPAFAQAPDLEAPAALEILDKAHAACIRETSDLSATLLHGPGAFTWLDLDGEFYPNDLVMNFNHIRCSALPALWAGSGGSVISVVLNGSVAATWPGRGWRRVEYGGVSVLLLSQHGSYCDSFGARACVLAVTVDAEGFSVIGGDPGTPPPWE